MLLLTTEDSMAANTSDFLTTLKTGRDDIKAGQMTSLTIPQEQGELVGRTEASPSC